jgi:hypothetical protein
MTLKVSERPMAGKIANTQQRWMRKRLRIARIAVSQGGMTLDFSERPIARLFDGI